MRQTMLGQLMPETDPANALALVVPLLFIKATGKLISLPGRAMTGMLSFRVWLLFQGGRDG